MKAFFTTTLLLAALTALFMMAGYLIGGQQGAILALAFAAVMNMAAYWNSDKVVLARYRAQPVDERSAPNLYGIVKELAARGNIPMPKVYIINEAQPNAFATGRSPQHAAVCATTGLLQRLSHDEVMGVIGHELGHVINRDMLTMTIAATFAGAIGYIANFGYLFARNRDNRSPLGPLGALLVMLIGPLAAAVVQMTISRTREYEADRMGAILSGKPRALASALANISRQVAYTPMATADAHPESAHLFIADPLSIGRLRTLFATHPPMEERIRRLLAMEGEISPALNAAPVAHTAIPRAGGMRGPWG